MAWNDQRDWIAAHYPADGARGIRTAGGAGEFAIRRGSSRRDFARRFEHLAGERCGPAQIHGNVAKILQLTGQMFADSFGQSRNLWRGILGRTRPDSFGYSRFGECRRGLRKLKPNHRRLV